MDEEKTIDESLSIPGPRLERPNRGMACLIIVSGPAIGKKFPIDQDHMIIGRSNEAAIQIDDPLVSREHAELLSRNEANSILRDLNSMNGTYCNGKKCSEKKLEDNDIIEIGKVMLKYIAPNSLEHLYLQEISNRATRDGLTGLFNREVFNAFLERNLSRCRSLKEPLALAMMDLDHFKKINDGWGHQAGDFVLREFSNLIKGKVRATDLLARYGGEEFGLIMPHTKTDETRSLVERIRTIVADHSFRYQEELLSITVSIGISNLEKGVKDSETMIRHADKALYEAKDKGRNRTVCFSGTS